VHEASVCAGRVACGMWHRSELREAARNQRLCDDSDLHFISSYLAVASSRVRTKSVRQEHHDARAHAAETVGARLGDVASASSKHSTAMPSLPNMAQPPYHVFPPISCSRELYAFASFK
jgi:hypothetical protein